MFNKYVTLNDFYSSMKHLFYSPAIISSTFASQINKSTNQFLTSNETNEKNHSEFPLPASMYYNVRATGDYRNCE